MTVMPQPDERKNTIIPLRNLNNSGTEDKNSFPLLSSPLFGAYLKQWSADKDTRTLSGTRVTFWWVLCKFVDRENKLKKKNQPVVALYSESSGSEYVARYYL